MDDWITIFTALTIISGAGLSFLGIAGGLKDRQSLGLWLLYATIVLALTWAFLYFQKGIWKEQSAVAARVDPNKRAELFIEAARMLPLEPGKSQKILLSVRNRGKLPARNINMGGANNRFLPKDFPGPLEYEQVDSDTRPDLAADAEAVMAVDAPMGITREKIQLLNDGELLFFHYGKGEYEDELGGPYPVDFCFMYTPLAPTILRTCPTRYWPKGGANTKEVLGIADRPYIGMNRVELVAPLTVGQHPIVRIVFVNGGKTPASSFVSHARIIVSNKPITEAMLDYPLGTLKSAETGSFLTAGMERRVEYPQTSLTITPQQLLAIRAGAIKLYVYGEARYRDTLGNEQVFPIRVVYDPSDGGFSEAD